MNQSDATKTCIYCGSVYKKDSEHVFPHGLGGERILMDCVCNKCNNSFSELEIELNRKSPVGFARSVEGITSYESSNDRPALFKAPLLLIHDEKNKIAYEVGQFKGLQLFIRAQIILIDDNLYIEGNNEDHEIFKAVLLKWIKESLRFIIEFPKSKDQPVVFAQFEKRDDTYSYKIVREEMRVTALDVVLNILEDDNARDVFLSPRLFLDDRKGLKVRARSIEDGIALISQLLAKSNKPLILHGYSMEPLPSDSPVIVGQQFNPLKMERAVVKIALNCLFYYFPLSRSNVALKECISYVRTASPSVNLRVVPKSNITDLVPNTHNVFFYQLESQLAITVSLFNGTMAFLLVISNLRILGLNNYSRLLIDYRNRKNTFQNQTEFHKSIITE